MTKEFEIREEVPLKATPEQVWHAIATSEGLAAWFQPAEIEPGSDMVVDWQPPQRLVTQMPGADATTTHRFEFVIEAGSDGSSILRFVHRGVEHDDWDEKFTAQGWEMYLATLVEYFKHFAGRPAVYAEAEGPSSSADPDAWPTLLGALGLTERIQIGDAVHIDLPGAGPIDGVLDYLAPDFIGLRTSDALVRFHGRAPIGLTVAVSHHAYGEGFDAAAATHGWEAWLASAFANERDRSS